MLLIKLLKSIKVWLERTRKPVLVVLTIIMRTLQIFVFWPSAVVSFFIAIFWIFNPAPWDGVIWIASNFAASKPQTLASAFAQVYLIVILFSFIFWMAYFGSLSKFLDPFGVFKKKEVRDTLLFRINEDGSRTSVNGADMRAEDRCVIGYVEYGPIMVATKDAETYEPDEQGNTWHLDLERFGQRKPPRPEANTSKQTFAFWSRK